MTKIYAAVMFMIFAFMAGYGVCGYINTARDNAERVEALTAKAEAERRLNDAEAERLAVEAERDAAMTELERKALDEKPSTNCTLPSGRVQRLNQRG